MGTRVKVTYVAIDNDGEKPILSAGSLKDLKSGLDHYYAIGRDDNECLGFYPYESKYPDEYEGYYEYKVKRIYSGRDEKPIEEINMVKVYSVNFYPHTIYEVNEK
jgi:hypothetical protein